MTPDEKDRRDAGARGELWRITVEYELGKEKKTLFTDNLLTREMKSFRENMFLIGLMVPLTPDSWRIIPPYCIGDVTITLQKKYFE